MWHRWILAMAVFGSLMWGQACFVSISQQRCHPLDPKFTAALCPCDEGLPCPEGMRCVAGRCSADAEPQVSSDATSPVEGSSPPDSTDPPEPRLECEPGATEACFTGSQDLRGQGICKEGVRRCVEGRWSECQGQQLPRKEECNGQDDDCNGKIDDSDKDGGLTRACYQGPANTQNKGICQGGTQVCSKGTWDADCKGQVLPMAEECNGKDDDCNGKVDEGCKCVDGQTQPCGGSDRGACKKGTQTCRKGLWSPCTGEVKSKAEVCDLIDNDCNGKIDDIKPRSCYTGPSGTAGKGSCKAGTQACSRGKWSTACTGEIKPKAEVCDGKDNDCNGKVDDKLSGQKCSTACGKGEETCTGGVKGCTAPAPSPEVCDGKDNDCNGKIDDGATAQKITDTFTAPTGNQVDILVVMDNSCSMRDAQSAVANGFSAFFTRAAQLKIDYQIGVTTTDVNKDKGQLLGSPTLLTAQTPNVASVFSQRVKLGTSGSAQEAGLQAALLALSAPLATTGKNKGILRPGALLTLLFVSDEPDQSTSPVSTYVQFFGNVKGTNTKEQVRVFVLGPPSTVCQGSCRYFDLLNTFKGNSQTLSRGATQPNLSSFFDKMAQSLSQRKDTFVLSHEPDPSTLKVAIGGSGVVNSPSNGWQYVAASQAVRFFGSAIPGPGANIVVTYTQKCGP